MNKIILTCFFLSWLAKTTMAKKPNIVFIFSDDHAYQSIGAYGLFYKDVAVTPVLDKLARDGMRFDKCYVTNSICGPSRAVVQTGKYSHKNGYTGNNQTFNGSQQTFPKIMRQHGYQTALIGKWHLKSDPQGFDHWDILPGQGVYYNPDFIKGDINGLIETRSITGYNTVVTTDLALDWLKTQRDTASPFMLMLQYKATHGNWQPGLDYLGMYDTVAIPEPPTLFDDYRYRGSAVHFQEQEIKGKMVPVHLNLTEVSGLTTEQKVVWDNYYDKIKAEWAGLGYDWKDTLEAVIRWKFQRYMKEYLAMAAQMDAEIGRVLDYLDSMGLDSNTVVMYSSDQGFYLGEHGWYDKRMMYEQSLRTPLIVRWPGVITPGAVNHDIVSNVDFPETFLDIAGIAIPGDMQGRSLAAIFEGNTPSDWRTSFYYQYYDYPGYHNTYRHYGVTTGRYKLIYFHDVDEWEFYDLKKDPDEMINQYFIPENDSIINELKEELDRLRSELEVPPSDVLQNKPPVVDVEKWNEPIPVGLFKDGSNSFSDGFIHYQRSNRRVVFELSGGLPGYKHSVSVRRVNGALLEALSPQPGPKFYWDITGVQPGIYVIELNINGQTGYVKIKL